MKLFLIFFLTFNGLQIFKKNLNYDILKIIFILKLVYIF